jgi:hypothetical protein
MESRYALLSTNGFVDSEDLALAASGDTTCVTSRDAISPSHIMSAVTAKSDNQPLRLRSIRHNLSQFHIGSLLP